jgi:hypothetical protein
VNAWLHHHSLQLWTHLHRTFDSDEPTTKWASRVICALLTAGACWALGHAATWASQAAGASSYLTELVAVLVLLAVFSVALVAVTAGPGHTRRPALIVLPLVTGFVLLVGLTGR